MSFVVEKTSKPRQLPPFGTHIARLYQIIDLGTHKEESTDQKTGAKSMRDRRKVRFVWELPLKTAVFRDGGEPEPFSVGRNFTLSLDKKSNLAPVIEGIIGRGLTDAERKSFDISKLVGEGCLLGISAHETQDGTESFKLGATSPLMEGQVLPPPFNKGSVYQVSDGPNAVFQTFPDWLKQEISTSHEALRKS